QILIQSGIIIAVHLTTCVSYELFQFVPANELLLYSTHVGWMMVHAMPPYIYILFNDTIRERI
ncbi:hypothetical protein PFISCL1PPCAC_13403, partial [Pristionchus fissidentatus]